MQLEWLLFRCFGRSSGDRRTSVHHGVRRHQRREITGCVRSIPLSYSAENDQTVLGCGVKESTTAFPGSTAPTCGVEVEWRPWMKPRQMAEAFRTGQQLGFEGGNAAGACQSPASTRWTLRPPDESGLDAHPWPSWKGMA